VAGGKGSTYNNDLLKLILNAVPIAGIADNAASGALTQLYVSLHLADPGAGGSQNTSEATYPGYARQGVSRTATGFTVSGATGTLAAAVIFPACTTWGSSETETWAVVGTAASGPGKILYRGPITPNLTVSSGVSPQLTTGTALTES
jgi:hypothetical protein